MKEFLMPSLGADMESAVLMEWLVKEGDSVSKGQVIAEVETSKGVIEIEVFDEGVIEKLLVEPETECAVGMPLAIIRAKGEEEAKKDISKEEPTPTKAVAEVKKEETPREERLKVSPAARKRAQELGVDLTTLTTRDAAIRLREVEAAATPTMETPKKTKELKTGKKDGMRQAIATAMSRSNAEIPHYYLSSAINMTPALTYLEELNETRSVKERILPVAMLVRAVVLALEEVPELNGFWLDNEHVMSQEIHPGIAIALRQGGLITPALLNAQEMNLDSLMLSMSDLISRTRANKLRSSEMTKQTITITNLGDLGVDSVFGVIYPPQLAVVGLGTIRDEPWAEGDALCVRKVMRATLAGDHRATDGRVGAKFLERLNKLLQNPKELL
jgi:pyruvate dehydrogenase E2 component (dihydrolipoamide acetyltransferase)